MEITASSLLSDCLSGKIKSNTSFCSLKDIATSDPDAKLIYPMTTGFDYKYDSNAVIVVVQENEDGMYYWITPFCKNVQSQCKNPVNRDLTISGFGMGYTLHANEIQSIEDGKVVVQKYPTDSRIEYNFLVTKSNLQKLMK